MQVICMLIHRWSTLMHYLANISYKSFRLELSRINDTNKRTLTIILHHQFIIFKKWRTYAKTECTKMINNGRWLLGISPLIWWNWPSPWIRARGMTEILGKTNGWSFTEGNFFQKQFFPLFILQNNSSRVGNEPWHAEKGNVPPLNTKISSSLDPIRPEQI